jgi:hypothetical protein
LEAHFVRDNNAEICRNGLLQRDELGDMTDIEIQALLDSLASKIERLDVHREIAML